MRSRDLKHKDNEYKIDGKLQKSKEKFIKKTCLQAIQIGNVNFNTEMKH